MAAESTHSSGADAREARYRAAPMTWLTIVLFCVGLALLVLGADWLVKGAARLAAAAGVSSLVIGLTVVAFGTSAPEMAVSVQAAWSGKADMAIGNVVGSNIFNVLFILGASALITPLVVAQQLVRRDVPIMIALSGILWLIARDGTLTRVDGALLFVGLVVYTVWIIRVSRRETKAVEAEYDAEYGPAEAKKSPMWLNVGYIVGGLVLLVLGSNWLVEGAVAFAHYWGISDVVVSLTIVAAGTSLPEVATSVTAAIRGERDIAVGNVVGSNIFNIMCVLGVSGMVSPAGLTVIESMATFDIPVMIAVAFACLPFFARGYTIPRWEGVLFLAYYVAYTTYLILDATQREAKAGYVTVMWQFVLPLTGVTLVVLAYRSLRAAKNGAAT
jgi:cation:H+ antiporter